MTVHALDTGWLVRFMNSVIPQQGISIPQVNPESTYHYCRTTNDASGAHFIHNHTLNTALC